MRTRLFQLSLCTFFNNIRFIRRVILKHNTRIIGGKKYL